MRKPLFIIGVDHSGTTLLYRMLARHPDFGWFSQYSQRGGQTGDRPRLPLHNLFNRWGNRLFGTPWRKTTGHGLRLRPVPKEGHGIWRRIMPPDDEFHDETDCTDALRDSLRATLERESAGWGRERLLLKIPYITRSTLLLGSVFEDALFVHIVRDGKACALSNRSRFPAEDETASLRLAAKNWSDTLDYIDRCEARFGPRLLKLAYESVCTDVRGAIATVLEFAEMDVGRFPMASIPETLTPTNHRWLDRCTQSDADLLDSTLVDTLARWGYTTLAARRQGADKPGG